MATALSLSPLFRHSIGFDRFNELFDTLASDDIKPAFPPYDIVKSGDNHYRIVMAVAGYREADIHITLDNDTLKISGQQAQDKVENDSDTWLHRGIARRSFERSFRLADHMKVDNASLEHGLLTITLRQEIPEEKKPQMIPISSKQDVIEQQ